jgi:hypothetical protein
VPQPCDGALRVRRPGRSRQGRRSLNRGKPQPRAGRNVRRGWPAGLYLAAVIARENNGQVRTVTGDDRYLADYLYREALTRQPEDIQRFLRRTAVLDQLYGSLCDAVLGSSASAGHLRHLEAASLFMIPLDRRRQWYRYHALFREFLLGELSRTEPDVIVTLHQRAADWYEAHGSPELEAAGRLKLALGTIDTQRLHAYVFSLPAFAGAARLSLHHGDVKEAHWQLTRAMRPRSSATYLLPYHSVRLRLQLAKVYLAIAEQATARQLLREIDDILSHRRSACSAASWRTAGPGIPAHRRGHRALP